MLVILRLVLTMGLLLFVAKGEASAFFETGQTTLNTTVDSGGWITVSTQKSYISPVVIAGPLTHSNDNSLSIRVRNVTATSFQIGMQSPCQSYNRYSNTSPPAANTCPSTPWQSETVQWLVIEQGTWIFPDGTKIEAYLHDTSTIRSKFGGNGNSGDDINMSHSYTQAPAVLHTVNTFNDANWVSSTVWQASNNRNNPPSTTSFRLALEGAEATTSHGVESIGWLAIERTNGTNLGHNYSAGRTAGRDVDRHNDECQAITYGTSFTNQPNLLAQHNSMSGGDGAWLRACGTEITAANFNVHMEEDQVRDTDRTGVPEYVSWFAFEQGSVGILEFLQATKVASDQDSNGLVGPAELINYVVTITNLQDDFAQLDNPASTLPEFIDSLDSNLEFESIISASSGVLSFNVPLNRFEWQGSVPASGVVTLNYQVRVATNSSVCSLSTIANQGQLNMDPIDNAVELGDIDSLNQIIEVTDDPAVDDGVDNALDLDTITDDDDPTLVSLGCQSNIDVTKSDSQTTYTPGGTADYVITINNQGPHDLVGATVTDVIPANVSVSPNWSCDPIIAPGDGSASCISGSAAGTTQTGTGNINLTVDIPVGKSLVIEVPATYLATP